MNIHDYARVGDQRGVARLLSEGVPVDSARNSDAFTPLMCAVLSERAGVEMVQLLIEAGTNVNAVAKDYWGKDSYSVLACAINDSHLDTIRLLLAAGADIGYLRRDFGDALYDAVYSRASDTESELVTLVELLLQWGAPLRGMSDDSTSGNSALYQAVSWGHFGMVRVLLRAGGDPTHLKWTPLMTAIALGDLADVARELAAGSDLTARDDWERTPWLLSLQVGDVEKSKLLLTAGANREDCGASGTTALMYAIRNKHIPLLRWLLAEGFDPDAANEYGTTPLSSGVTADCIECVRILIAAGAQVNFDVNEPLMEGESSLEMISFLREAGATLEYPSREVRALLTGVETEGELRSTSDEYLAGKRRRFGTDNPERMEVAFWEDMVRSGIYAWGARKTFDDTTDLKAGPVWCFERFGKSFTPLEDGRFVEVAGEHEDSYDPDFCIYNDVVVHHGNGKFEIFGYPREIFPPTDFHSATLVGEFIYLIGSLGYRGERHFGETPVYRLHCGTWAIGKVETSGEKPGWIYKHRAVYSAEQHSIHLSSGTIVTRSARDEAGQTQESHDQNEHSYRLDLTSLSWRRMIDKF